MKQITARWVGCVLVGSTGVVDIIEVNKDFYFYVGQSLSNEDIEKIFNDPENKTKGSTIEEMEASNDALGVLSIIRKRKPNWILFNKCECGGDKVGGGHSNWCPKYA
jgi:hypothetical protein